MHDDGAAQPPSPRNRSIAKWCSENATTLLLAGCLLAIVGLYGGFGISWDEDVQTRYGEAVLDYFLSGGSDRSFEELHNLRYYGALFELASAAFHRALGADPFEHRSLLTALVALFTIAGAASMARRLGAATFGHGGGAAFFTALVLVLMPRFVGHGFVNSKDIPFACAVTWSLYLVTRLLLSKVPRTRDVVLLGVAVGCAMALRAVALGFLVYLALAILTLVVLRRRAKPIGRQLGEWLPRYALLVAVAWFVMVVFWPFAHAAPLGNPLRAIVSGHGAGAVIGVRYLGEIHASTKLPGHYLAWHLLIVTPFATTVFAAIGTWTCISRLAGRAPEGHEERGAINLMIVSLLLWVFGPLLAGFALAPNVYDGIRHILFLLPGLAILAGIGIAGCGRWVEGVAHRRVRIGIGAIVLAITAWSALSAGRYSITYFNALAGPTASLHERYDTDYWVTSYREAAEWVNRQQEKSERPLRVLVAADHYNEPSFRHFLDEDIGFDRTTRPDRGTLPEAYDYYVATTRYDWHEGFAATPVAHDIRSRGMLLTRIRGRP